VQKREDGHEQREEADDVPEARVHDAAHGLFVQAQDAREPQQLDELERLDDADEAALAAALGAVNPPEDTLEGNA